MFGIFKDLFDSNKKELSRLQKIVEEINNLEAKAKKITDSNFKVETEKLKKTINGKAQNLTASLPWAYALVREAAYRVLGERHYNVQLMAAIALHEGKIVEQKTGEGKTLSATAPLYLNALVGKGAHLVTVNDYLARRDAGWMGMVFDFLGLTTSAIISDHSYIFDAKFTDKNTKDWRIEHLKEISRKDAYLADITYGINSEFGFDYLRDNMAFSAKETVQREFFYAIVDEVDSVLIDEARTPHIISAPYGDSVDRYYKYAQIVERLMSDTDYVIDEKLRTANLTERGIEKVEKILGVNNIYESDYDTLFHVEAALKARTLFKDNKDYIIRNNEVVIVDEFTGRLLEGRRFSEGIHQAIEAKENVPIKQESKTLATVSLQNYFRMYQKLAGMTGTALTEAEEFNKIYKLEVIVIPTNKNIVRKDQPDYIYQTERGKFTALVEEIAKIHKTGRPILVGTTNIDKNEVLSLLLKKKGIKHEILNAKNHEREALIISNAGNKGAVTIATNMAGRGVDIILGGTPPSKYEKGNTKSYEKEYQAWQKTHNEVIKLGGLFVVGTERHESRRIDNQLRGRSGRQGDPGETRFFISLEDDMLRIFGGEQIGKLMNFFNFPENQPIEHGMVSRAIEQAQVKVEGFNFDIRKHLLEFDDVLNKQREIVYAQRRRIIEMAAEKNGKLDEFLADQTEKVLSQYLQPIKQGISEAKAELIKFMESLFTIPDEAKKDLLAMDYSELKSRIEENITKIMENKKERFGEEIFKEGVKLVYVSTIDHFFTEHLTHIENLREGINLRGYAQLDPLNEYKKESFDIFNNMLSSIRSEFLRRLIHLEVEPQTIAASLSGREAGQAKQESISALSAKIATNQSANTEPLASNRPKTKAGVNRNDPCPCGAVNPKSGKPYKYKKCGLINAPYHKG